MKDFVLLFFLFLFCIWFWLWEQQLFHYMSWEQLIFFGRNCVKLVLILQYMFDKILLWNPIVQGIFFSRGGIYCCELQTESEAASTIDASVLNSWQREPFEQLFIAPSTFTRIKGARWSSTVAGFRVLIRKDALRRQKGGIAYASPLFTPTAQHGQRCLPVVGGRELYLDFRLKERKKTEFQASNRENQF